MEDPIEQEDLVTIEQAASRLNISSRTAWEVLRRCGVDRYRVPGQGKTTYVRWPDLERAYRTPRMIGPLAEDGDESKKLAA